MKSERRRFSLCYKLKVIHAFETIRNYSQVAKIFKITRRHVRVWVRNKQTIAKMTAKNRRLNAGYSRSSNFENLEDELKIWITETRNSGACVSGKLIQTKALEMSVRHGVNDRFKASQGWLRNFLRRNNLVLRRITSKGRSLPQNSIETINQFISKCADETSGVNKDEIYSMDETTIYLDSPSKKILKKKIFIFFYLIYF